MKATTSAALKSLVVGVLIPFFASAAPKALIQDELLVDTFKSCAQAVRDPTEASGFNSSVLTIRDGYPVTVFLAKHKQPTPPQPPRKTRIVVWIEDGPGIRPENPRITAVCIDSTLLPQKPGVKYGDIDFKSLTGDDILIRFHLEGLKISKWKKKTQNGIDLANDSVLMKEFPEGTKPPSPNPVDWPDCVKPKTVAISGTADSDVSFDFSRCANPGNNTIWYVYALVLDQYPAGGPPTEVPIDPLIINRPP